MRRRGARGRTRRVVRARPHRSRVAPRRRIRLRQNGWCNGWAEDEEVAGWEASQGRRRRRRRTPARFLVPGIDEPPPPPEHLAPLGKELVFTGHTDSVSAVAWESVERRLVRRLRSRVEIVGRQTQQNTQSYDVPKAIMGMACVAGGGRVAWCGGGDKAVHMWDPRVGATTGATTSLMSHTVRVIRLAFYEFFFWFFSRPLCFGCFRSFGAAAGVGDETTFVSRVGDDVGDKTITLIFS